MSRRRFLIIHNLLAGTKRRGLFLAVLRELEQRGCVVTTQIAEDIETDRTLAAQGAASGDYDAVVAAGGDGTIRGVALGLFGTTLPLGVIPVGTGNVMAAELGLKREVGAVVDCLLEGRVREVRCATANGEPFLLMAGAGYDGTVVSALSFNLKRLIGRAAYGWPALTTLFRLAPELRVDVDGAANEARWVVVTNARRYGGTFVLADTSSIFEPGLTAVLFRPRSRAEFASQLLHLASGRLSRAPGVLFLPGHDIRIESETPVAVQLDGESFGTTPLAIADDERTLLLIIPRHMAVADPQAAA